MIGAAADWSLMDPWFLAAVPLVWLLFAWRLLRSRAALPTASAGLLLDLPKTLRVRLWMSPLVLQALALTAFAVALARPVTRDVFPLHEEGVDIVLTIDISSSMTTEDMDDTKPVTRMRVAREKALEFARARVHDRVGLLTFARFPELRCPLTLDQDALAAFLRTIDTVPPRSPENTTAIGVALAKAVTLLEGSEAKSKVVILLSDGENLITDIMPADAAKLAKDAGVTVHCIGIGRGQVVQGFFGQRQRQLEPEFNSLKEIAATADGEFFTAESAEDLAAVYRKINEMEKVELEDPRYKTVDRYVYPFGVGALLLLLQLLVELAWIRRVP